MLWPHKNILTQFCLNILIKEYTVAQLNTFCEVGGGLKFDFEGLGGFV